MEELRGASRFSIDDMPLHRRKLLRSEEELLGGLLTFEKNTMLRALLESGFRLGGQRGAGLLGMGMLEGVGDAEEEMLVGD